ncbi:hypothetical protein [Pasteurella oralis]|uniref:hypothetical protein n=1 Tax=Pasteurella oralis TaxID=1071947 RepID=UPI000C7DEABA|nr:hypothetical protein [Pasteurella oralis]
MLVINMKEDLERALNNKEPSFIIEGELAEKIKKAKKITTINKLTLVAFAIVLAVAFIPSATDELFEITRDTILMAIGILIGLEIAIILAVLFGGMTLAMMLYKNYHTEFGTDLKTEKITIKCTRKK